MVSALNGRRRDRVKGAEGRTPTTLELPARSPSLATAQAGDRPEVRHLQLPVFSHSLSALMHARWEGRILDAPRFTEEQGTTTRVPLVAANGN